MKRGVLTTEEIAEEFTKKILAEKYVKKIKVSLKDANGNLIDIIDIPDNIYNKHKNETIIIKFE
ncbi:MAG: hypothetical protein BWY04_01516 [candidate division CPR1 bacterium ADurb.Bin160]|uniref:Uncharacterized protein n=1 Tax=candidate division CPR1 bacterium ADurb.Bin160 TaxID=1852826 RepID=A0A1V5ZI61_9BACT|nr:MAG: hypothetical protein BWY04_01516 [candidate division CPR1 bacterium ADurb.Bin160]